MPSIRCPSSNYTRLLFVVSVATNATPLRFVCGFFHSSICESLRTETVKPHNSSVIRRRKSQLNSIRNGSTNLLELIFVFFFFVSFLFSDKASDKSDQSTAESWWRSHLTTPSADVSIDTSNFFSATHGLVQTHPALSGGIPRPALSTTNLRAGSVNPALSGGIPRPPLNPALAATPQNPKSPFRHLDFASSATAELRRNPSLSAPDECARACREGEPPRICYYHFTLEYYTVLGA